MNDGYATAAIMALLLCLFVASLPFILAAAIIVRILF